MLYQCLYVRNKIEKFKLLRICILIEILVYLSYHANHSVVLAEGMNLRARWISRSSFPCTYHECMHTQYLHEATALKRRMKQDTGDQCRAAEQEVDMVGGATVLSPDAHKHMVQEYNKNGVSIICENDLS